MITRDGAMRRVGRAEEAGQTGLAADWLICARRVAEVDRLRRKVEDGSRDLGYVVFVFVWTLLVLAFEQMVRP